METMLQLEHMKVEKEGKLAWLTFTRERYLNAMNNVATIQLKRLVMLLREDPDVRVVIIRGQGRAFSTGLDLKALAAGKIEPVYYHRWEQIMRMLETMEKIVVVGMQGYCLGGGLQLALAADIRISTPECYIGLPAIKESLIPGLGSWRLPKYVGMGWAKKLILGGENISGAKALQLGLVDHLVEEDNFFQHIDTLAKKYLSACSTGTRMSKLLINKAFDMDYEAVLAYYLELQDRTHYSMDAEEAKRAYLEKCEPDWQ